MMTAVCRRDLLKIMDDRHRLGSRIEQWREIIGRPSIAGAIVDPPVHNAYSRTLEGES